MEISPAIHSFSRFTHYQKPLKFPFSFSQSSLSSISKYKLHDPSSPFYQKWREQQQPTSIRALSNEPNGTVDLAEKPVDADPSLVVKKKAMDVHADLKGASIFLVGMNSALKSSVGKLIADVLRYYYFDSDSLVEEAAGEDSSGKSFKERDEAGFRESETEVLTQLSSMGRLVVNAGNGAVESATNLALLRHGISIWIDVPLDMIAKGIIGDNGQLTTSGISTPESFSEALAKLTRLYKENKAGFATADATVSIQRLVTEFGYDEFEQVTVEDMALQVLKEIEKLTRVKKMMAEAGKPF